jgi:zinc D-Ala-D-Ala carboxypeptidase
MSQPISLHISWREATFSLTAARLGLDNTPGADELANMRAIANDIFEPMRAYVGGPIHISSFFRSKALNKAVGGSTSSQHCTGEAMDLDMDHVSFPKASNADLFEYVRTRRQFDQLIWEFGTRKQPDWVHVSYKRAGPNRMQVLRASRKNGQTTYMPWLP